VRGEKSTDLCLDVVIIGGGSRDTSGCFSPTGHAQGTTAGPDGVTLVGAASQEVGSLDVSYSVNGDPGAVTAVLARAEDREILRRVGAGEPFTLYVSRLPARAEQVEAGATDASGEPMWTAEFRVPETQTP
jgi:hypothetical protein